MIFFAAQTWVLYRLATTCLSVSFILSEKRKGCLGVVDKIGPTTRDVIDHER